MNKNKVYIWYSSATDVTGKKLQDTLGIKGGNKVPDPSFEIIIGWGTKHDSVVNFPTNTKTLNHPNAIKNNRNKLEALSTLADNNISVASFTDSDDVLHDLSNNILSLPIVARTKYHQGGKGFWVCPTITHVKNAINEGAHYFQNMIEIKDEYRIHVFNDEIIYAVKKIKRTPEEFEEAFIEDEMTRQKKLAEKNNNPFDEATALLMLKRQAKNATAGGANMMIRSNKMGWKFSRINNIPENISTEAIKAIKALNLNFGAVDCCVDAAGKVFIIEVNTGPGLEGTTFDNYVEAFNKFFNTPKKIEIVDIPKIELNNEAKILSAQLKRLQLALNNCTNEEELIAIKKVGSSILFG